MPSCVPVLARFCPEVCQCLIHFSYITLCSAFMFGFDYPVFIECNFMGVLKTEPVKTIFHIAAMPVVVAAVPIDLIPLAL